MSTLQGGHDALLKSISSYATANAFREIGIATLINVDHYIYETTEMSMVALANTYLSHEESDTFEKTQDIDEEIYESFSIDDGPQMT